MQKNLLHSEVQGKITLQDLCTFRRGSSDMLLLCFIIPLIFLPVLLHFASSFPPFGVFVCQRGRETSSFHHHLSFTDATKLLFPLSDIVITGTSGSWPGWGGLVEPILNVLLFDPTLRKIAALLLPCFKLRSTSVHICSHLLFS